jgi:hypothetical protein
MLATSNTRTAVLSQTGSVPSPSLAAWRSLFTGDDIRDLRTDISAGLIDFAGLEMS